MLFSYIIERKKCRSPATGHQTSRTTTWSATFCTAVGKNEAAINRCERRTLIRLDIWQFVNTGAEVWEFIFLFSIFWTLPCTLLDNHAQSVKWISGPSYVMNSFPRPLLHKRRKTWRSDSASSPVHRNTQHTRRILRLLITGISKALGTVSPWQFPLSHFFVLLLLLLLSFAPLLYPSPSSFSPPLLSLTRWPPFFSSSDFHSLAQTVLALTPGHPMLSLSNYLTNRRETALISAYCFSPAESEHRLGVFLENRGAGGKGGRPRRPRLLERGEQQHCCSETSQALETHTSVRAPPPTPPTPSLPPGPFQLVMAL